MISGPFGRGLQMPRLQSVGLGIRSLLMHSRGRLEGSDGALRPVRTLLEKCSQETLRPDLG